MRNLILGFVFGVLVVSVIEQEERITALEERLDARLEPGQTLDEHGIPSWPDPNTLPPMYYASTR